MMAVFIIGRILLGGFFVYNGYNHFKNQAGLVAYAQMKKVPAAKAAVLLGGAMLLLGGLSIIVNRFSILGMILLVLFLVPTTVMMHPFWKELDPQQKMSERIAFNKNVAIIGALLMMIAIG